MQLVLLSIVAMDHSRVRPLAEPFSSFVRNHVVLMKGAPVLKPVQSIQGTLAREPMMGVEQDPAASRSVDYHTMPQVTVSEIAGEG